jgi:hypothetical protein
MKKWKDWKERELEKFKGSLIKSIIKKYLKKCIYLLPVGFLPYKYQEKLVNQIEGYNPRTASIVNAAVNLGLATLLIQMGDVTYVHESTFEGFYRYTIEFFRITLPKELFQTLAYILYFDSIKLIPNLIRKPVGNLIVDSITYLGGKIDGYLIKKYAKEKFELFKKDLERKEQILKILKGKEDEYKRLYDLNNQKYELENKYENTKEPDKKEEIKKQLENIEKEIRSLRESLNLDEDYR